ncbi:unnamed protein product [Peronospora belbahrii]|uniref:Uncharacterized protein n=1 Tax=Peronospora belbahrii TaxID=622444 RepID=A0AAU9KYT5_9STRA|nr:unnamed protein product [Peronospora belbahrii]
MIVLESFHRQQLRKVIGVRYPDTISNAKLYDRTQTEPLRFHLLRSRWSLYGHILRRPAGIPAYRSMETFINPSATGKWSGRRRLTLPMVLNADLETLSPGRRFQRVLPSPMCSGPRSVEGLDRGACSARAA